jgi:RNA polymerase sigma-54 factor
MMSPRQQMSASLRMQQAIRLLQMSALEFHQELDRALGSNPFLDEDDDADRSPSVETEPLAVAPPGCAESGQEGSHGDIAFHRPARPRSELEGLDAFDRVRTAETLHDHLREQVCSQPMSERERILAALVIEALDQDGYLRDDINDGARAAGLLPMPEPDEIASAIQLVQQLNPPGVAARNLRECLLLQLNMLPPDTGGRDLAVRLIAEGLDLLARRDWPALQARFDCSEAELRVAHALIRLANPRPGSRFVDSRQAYVEPDILVVEHRGELLTQINPAMRPKARLNTEYADLLRHSSANATPLRQQLLEARWLLRNAEQRLSTIQRVAEAIVRRQRAFFSYGDIALKPLQLRDVAEELDMHESTVSRATANKYMATPRGLFALKHFFPRELATQSGGRCSAATVRALLREMIEAEPGGAPVSDVVLTRQLAAKGIHVARRTVSKYRNMLKLPAAEFRRMAGSAD